MKQVSCSLFHTPFLTFLSSAEVSKMSLLLYTLLVFIETSEISCFILLAFICGYKLLDCSHDWKISHGTGSKKCGCVFGDSSSLTHVQEVPLWTAGRTDHLQRE